MRSREEAEVISDDGYFCTIVARLMEYSMLELHKYVRIFFESGVNVPVVILWLWGGAMDPLDNLPPFLLQMGRLMSIKSGSRKGLSSMVGVKLTQLGGLYMENPSRRVRRVNSSFSPLYRSANIAARAVRESRPFRPQCEASSSPLYCHIGSPLDWSG